MKVIDVECRGNLIKIYYGADECTEYWGDDWNDRGTEDTVYDKYVVATTVYAIPWDYEVTTVNGKSKAAFKANKEPFVTFTNGSIHASLHFEMDMKEVGYVTREIDAVLMSEAAYGVANHPKNI